MKKRTMINILFSIVTTASMMSCASQKNGAVKDEIMDVTLNITVTSDYCGGAAPPEEMLARLKKPRKFAKQKFYISNKESLQDNMQEMTTSLDGKATIPLPKGIYYVFLQEKLSAKVVNQQVSEKQCDAWKNKPNGTFNVDDNNNVSFNVHKTCDICGALRM